MQVQVFPLVPNAILPVKAPAMTRRSAPSGYGVQEQCLPFTAATALGWLIRSPFAFGLCTSDDVPRGARTFRAPLQPPSDARVFYVVDDAACRFERNAFTFETLLFRDGSGKLLAYTPVEPGLSFFERDDQTDLFKVHLPYVIQTPSDVGCLFIPALNRDSTLTVLSGLVETDWYAHPVNLVARIPSRKTFHVAKGHVI